MDGGNWTAVTEFIFLAFSSSSRYPALVFTMFLLMYLVILFGNTLMILTIKNDSHLHTPMYFFVCNLSCLDLCHSSAVVPQSLVNLLSFRHSISFFRCATQLFCTILFGLPQIFLVTVMAYDRYVAISNPLRYKTVMNWTVCIKLFTIVMICGLVFAFLFVTPIFSLPFCGHEINHFFCDISQVFLLTCARFQIFKVVEGFLFLTGLFLFTIPFLLIVTSYVYIILAILKIRTNQGRRKAFSTCSSHLTVVAVEYACLGFMYLKPKESYSLDKDKIFVVVFTFVTPILNPMVYSVRNKAVQRGFRKLLHKKLH